MEFILHGYCGVFCGACPNLLATRDGRIDETRQCFGCKSLKPTGFCKTCGIKACAQHKGYDLCGQCTDLQTCEMMLKFMADQQYPYGQCLAKNMESIREQGLAGWLEMQDRRWRCAACGTRHSWYQETCPHCGQVVADYRADLN